MRHNVAFRKFARTQGHRRALLRNMATALIIYGHYETTVQKAKDLRGVVERLITKARVDTVASRRRASAYLMTNEAVKKLFVEIAPGYKSRPGGYTRVLRTRRRAGDAAEMACIELIAAEESNKGTKKKANRKQAAEEKSA